MVMNLIGQKFGKLTVIEQMPSKNQRRQWKCLCDCGNITIASTTALRSGDTSSCGCLKHPGNRKKGQERPINRNGGRKPEDLSGQKFGLLVALEPTEQRKNGSVVWKCKCDCGNITYKTAAVLKSNLTKSCGCIKSYGEYQITRILQKNNINFIQEYNIKINNKNRRFDFAIIENNKVSRLIEFDGPQHENIKQSGYFQETHKDTLQRDQEKNIWAQENNIPLVRIPYKIRDTITLEDLFSEKYVI